jgi:hypothetical protein
MPLKNKEKRMKIADELKADPAEVIGRSQRWQG